MSADAPRILALVGDISGCTLWRVFQPFAELQKHGIFAHWKARDDPENNDPRFIAKLPYNFDAVLLPRLFWTSRTDAQRFIGAMHRAGLVCIVETDDDVYSPAIVERAFATQDTERDKGLRKLEEERQARIDVLQLADGVTVTTRRLRTIVSQYTDAPVEVVPNAIDTHWFRETLRGCRRVVDPLTIGWAGGSRYYEDLEPVAEAWHNLGKRYPDVTFVVQGFLPDVLVNAVPPDRCRRLGWLPLHEYPRALLNFDIGVASVAPKLFNTAKTPIKVWEYAMAGVPAVASPTLYGQVVADGEDGLLAETAAEWEAQLALLIDDAELRRRLWRAQRRRVAQHHSLEHNWQQWPIAWSHILDESQASRSPTIRLPAIA
jgi:glycosyltransferase involved in cell wall biosynthesis